MNITVEKDKIQEIENLFSSLMDADIQNSMGGLGGCPTLNMESYPEAHRPFIETYLKEKTNSVALALTYYESIREN